MPELKEVLDDNYLSFLNEAYKTIKTESDRKKYDEMLSKLKNEPEGSGTFLYLFIPVDLW